MNNTNPLDNDQLDLDTLPKAKLRRSRKISFAWFIPIIAALAGAWLVIKVLNEKGPDIDISFSSAEGFEIGKTRLRYKDVDVGKVKNISLDDDLERVLVTVQVSKTMGKHLNENSNFWAVRPRISAKGISGLSTLISGVYIAMDPGESAQPVSPSKYMGLEEPPQLPTSAQGRPYALVATQLGSLDIGSPVYFRQIQVGEVISYKLHQSGEYVNLNIFIREPYDQLVKANSRFWNSSGFDLDLGADGIKAHVESLTSLISGGIVFDSPRTLLAGYEPPHDHEYFLHADASSINDQSLSLKLEYVMYFDESLKGLNVDAPVDFRGSTVGKVLDKETRVDPISLTVISPVLVELYPERLALQDDAIDPSQVIESLVEEGLRARIKTGNLLTGQMYIDLDFEPQSPDAQIEETGYYAKFPTTPGQFGEITRSLSNLMNKLDQVPLDDLAKNLNKTLVEINALVSAPENKRSLKNLEVVLSELQKTSRKFGHLADRLTPRLDSTLASADTTMKGLAETLANMNTTLKETSNSFSEDSTFHYKLRILLDELTEASRSMDALVDTLQRKPDALIFGK